MAMGRRGQGRGRRRYQWPFYDFLRAVCRWFSASIATMTMLHARCSNTLGPPLKDTYCGWVYIQGGGSMPIVSKSLPDGSR